jgi:dephospho-CoA kinase
MRPAVRLWPKESPGLAAGAAGFRDGNTPLPDGNLDRPKVAAKVFRDPAAKKKLEAVIHKDRVWAEAAKFYKPAKRTQGSPVVFLDVPPFN